MRLWIIELVICILLIIMAFTLFQSHKSLWRRVGGFILMGATGLAFWFWTGSLATALGGIALWFIFPIVQAGWLSRRIRFSVRRQLEAGSFDPEHFPELQEISAEIRRLGFSVEGDYWLRPSVIEQGYRLFRHKDEPLFAAIAVVRHGPAVLHYMMFLTPGSDENLWLTWDYPLAYGLLMPPDAMVYRYMDAATLDELLSMHREFLKVNEIQSLADEKNSSDWFEKLFNRTIDYNMHRGLLEHSMNEVAYTWRGTAFVLWQVFCEVIKG